MPILLELAARMHASLLLGLAVGEHQRRFAPEDVALVALQHAYALLVAYNQYVPSTESEVNRESESE